MRRLQKSFAHATIKQRFARLWYYPQNNSYMLEMVDGAGPHEDVIELVFDHDEEKDAERTAETFCGLDVPPEPMAPRAYCTCGCCLFCMVGQRRPSES